MDHLPECPVPEMEAAHGPLHPEDAEANCMCDRLRACEQRVLDAAREAIMGVSVYRWAYSEPKDPYTECITVDSAVAAINALKEKP